MTEKLIFEIPVYRISHADHTKETRDLLEKDINGNINSLIDQGIWSSGDIDLITEWKERWKWSFYRSYVGRDWKYNEIVGFIRLYACRRTIKADYWFVNAKRLRRNLKTKVFQYNDELFSIDINDDDTSLRILKMILNNLGSLETHFRLRKRHIDLEVFNNISPKVNWKELIND